MRFDLQEFFYIFKLCKRILEKENDYDNLINKLANNKINLEKIEKQLDELSPLIDKIEVTMREKKETLDQIDIFDANEIKNFLDVSADLKNLMYTHHHKKTKSLELKNNYKAKKEEKMHDLIAKTNIRKSIDADVLKLKEHINQVNVSTYSENVTDFNKIIEQFKKLVLLIGQNIINIYENNEIFPNLKKGVLWLYTFESAMIRCLEIHENMKISELNIDQTLLISDYFEAFKNLLIALDSCSEIDEEIGNNCNFVFENVSYMFGFKDAIDLTILYGDHKENLTLARKKLLNK